MTKPQHATGYVPNADYSQEDWNEVSNNPELTDKELAQARLVPGGLASEVFAKLVSDADEARIQAGIAADPDNPELTDYQLAQMRPAREVLPAALYRALTKRDRREP